jgi:ferredoxin-nitrite reductase
MMRTKLPNGILTSAQVRCLADIVAMHPDDGCADITTRQNWQLRGMTKEDIPTIIEKLDSAGLTSFQSGLDNVRNTVGNPIAGIDPEEIIDTYPICLEIDRYILNGGKCNPEITNLPRKWNVSVVGTHDLFEHPHINDLAFMPATKDGVLGFNVLVGGFFSATRCAEAIPMDAWVPVSGVVPLTHAILTAFRDFGSRANRQKCRMMWLIEDMGMDNWRAEVTRRMPGATLVSGGLADPSFTSFQLTYLWCPHRRGLALISATPTASVDHSLVSTLRNRLGSTLWVWQYLWEGWRRTICTLLPTSATNMATES